MILRIRPVKVEDARFLHEMRIMDGVRENILGITSERYCGTEDFISSLTENHHMFVAEVEEQGMKSIVGNIALVVNKSPRKRHSGTIGVMVHKDYQGQGIGRALFNKVLDLSDNWLMLVRLELSVFIDNDKALSLYKSLGFEIEGTKRYAAIRNGKYDDEYIMARYNIK